ncbi:cytochrome c biogenesis CcdA family protein [Ostreiculturibacter nitratireducens]|uniref:cytochrome c biogenesis CcdA family protein n=1 Tax=Ostreiculturibacter nitratireducens TaxID=3075226 RepID=UPI0031B56958
MEFILGYGAGILTLINPCILPVLPIVLAASLQAGRWGPVTMAAGMSLAFVGLGLTVASAGRSLGLSEDGVIRAAAVMMLGFGLVLLVPRFGARFALAAEGFAMRADAGAGRLDMTGLPGQFLGGALLGGVWSPCIGPTLGGAIGLAAQGGSLVEAGAIMLAFALGVSTVIVAVAYGARGLLQKRRALMTAIAQKARPILGLAFVGVAVMILTGLNHVIEAWAIEHLPIWLQNFSVSI